jgi:hypothetical protein
MITISRGLAAGAVGTYLKTLLSAAVAVAILASAPMARADDPDPSPSPTPSPEEQQQQGSGLPKLPNLPNNRNNGARNGDLADKIAGLSTVFRPGMRREARLGPSVPENLRCPAITCTAYSRTDGCGISY